MSERRRPDIRLGTPQFDRNPKENQGLPTSRGFYPTPEYHFFICQDHGFLTACVLPRRNESCLLIFGRLIPQRHRFAVDVPAITSRSFANALTACSALLLFHGTPFDSNVMLVEEVLLQTIAIHRFHHGFQ